MVEEMCFQRGLKVLNDNRADLTVLTDSSADLKELIDNRKDCRLYGRKKIKCMHKEHSFAKYRLLHAGGHNYVHSSFVPSVRKKAAESSWHR